MTIRTIAGARLADGPRLIRGATEFRYVRLATVLG